MKESIKTIEQIASDVYAKLGSSHSKAVYAI